MDSLINREFEEYKERQRFMYGVTQSELRAQLNQYILSEEFGNDKERDTDDALLLATSKLSDAQEIMTHNAESGRMLINQAKYIMSLVRRLHATSK